MTDTALKHCSIHWIYD